MTLVKAKELEGEICQSEDNMKIPLLKVKARKNDSCKHESDTSERKCAQKQQLGKLTK